ncbi:anti-sigma factor antagonist [Pseudonocardia acidicola]|uniref:Anti-sigma factor antagonist n=1 Tax=Pseudonocardia acidicola TaxID=2724939 RepID=A0ABX1SE19_9PSEU|nr:STAS domain-containing protein [Pseudonocardia acidicola]
MSSHNDSSRPAESLTVTVRVREDGICVVTVAGAVDLLTGPRLQAAVREALLGSSAVSVVDLTDVSFFGSHGVQVLAEAVRVAHRLREPLRLVVDGNRPVIRPIQLTGLDRMLALYHSLDDAIAGTGRIPPGSA